MTRPLARRLYDLLRGASRERSLERLRREGHRKVSVIRFSDVERMLAEAVDQALADLGLQVDARQAAELSEDARTRFMALLRERDTLRETVDELQKRQDELAKHRDVLAAELSRSEEELVESRERRRRDPWAPDDAAALQARLEVRLGALLSDRDPEERARLASAGAQAIAEELAQHLRIEQDARVEQLERRVDKLRLKLEESESLLRRARAAQTGPAGLLPGAASVADAERAAARRLLLEEIFQMNVELKTMIADLPQTGENHVQ